ncbi:hypothetical protein N657DRAFT_317404 [Parathielavia appendiculata]|uniref:Uncharacterized protein n=1 Tax=Parathielavia appendiculata TaxID=2587402 RepID=A0AAN6TSE7_9PEZI|nr:hypothetical protein N657DRAFT_317404 [Parathielavia appendiculata]
MPGGPEEQLDAIASLGKRPAAYDTANPYPVCGHTLVGLKPYIRHVGCHLEQLALFALPLLEDENGSEDAEADGQDDLLFDDDEIHSEEDSGRGQDCDQVRGWLRQRIEWTVQLHHEVGQPPKTRIRVGLGDGIWPGDSQERKFRDRACCDWNDTPAKTWPTRKRRGTLSWLVDYTHGRGGVQQPTGRERCASGAPGTGKVRFKFVPLIESIDSNITLEHLERVGGERERLTTLLLPAEPQTPCVKLVNPARYSSGNPTLRTHPRLSTDGVKR